MTMSAVDTRPRIAPERIVDNRVYTDQRVFDAEVAQIFERVWMFACHESEIRRPGDFLTMTIAGTPLIVNRDGEGTVRAFCNTCRHRGSLVVADEKGHCKAFRCPYHSWGYSLGGQLLSIPGEEAYDGTGFRKDDFPLVSVGCESVLGFVFVNLSDAPQPLAEWLGPDVIDVLSKPMADGDYEVFYQHSDPLPVNWKIFAENGRDGYHVAFVHPFLRSGSPPGTYHLFDHGHAVQHLSMDPKSVEPEIWEEMAKYPLPGLTVGEGYIVNVFPDVAIQVRSNVVSIDFQRIIGPSEIVMENRTLGLAGDTSDMVAARRLNSRYWVTDRVQLEDYPVFRSQHQGVTSRKVRYSIIARGADGTTGTRGDDNRLRQFWTEWRRLLGVRFNSLDDLPDLGVR
jgi:phenylpropionate dioxygenase-like ring-hydroxylating dioxygenase large terminal subunit